MSQQKFVLSVLQDAAENNKPQLPLPITAATTSESIPFSFIDLFAGIGGFRIPLDKFGGKCVFSSEINTYTQKTYKAWFGETPSGDITEISPASIPDHDILAAGFPCQPFSLAGVSKKNSLKQENVFSCYG